MGLHLILNNAIGNIWFQCGEFPEIVYLIAALGFGSFVPLPGALGQYAMYNFQVIFNLSATSHITSAMLSDPIVIGIQKPRDDFFLDKVMPVHVTFLGEWGRLPTSLRKHTQRQTDIYSPGPGEAQ